MPRAEGAQQSTHTHAYSSVACSAFVFWRGWGGFLMILLNVVKMWFLPSASPPPPSTHSQPTINHPPTLQYHVMHCDAPRGCRSAIAPLSCASSPHSQQTDSSRGQRTASSSSAQPPSKVQSGQCLNFFFGGGGKAGSLTHTHTRAHPNRLTDTHTLSVCGRRDVPYVRVAAGSLL